MEIRLRLRILAAMRRLSVRCLRGVLGVVSLLRLGCAVDEFEEGGGERKRRGGGRSGKEDWRGEHKLRGVTEEDEKMW